MVSIGGREVSVMSTNKEEVIRLLERLLDEITQKLKETEERAA